MTTGPANPLSAAAAVIPARAFRAGSVALRLAGAALIVSAAFDQSYDPTQWFAVLVASLAVASFVPLPGEPGDLLAAFGAGAIFFAGAVLTHLTVGTALLVVGALAVLAVLAFAHSQERYVTLPALAFLGASVVAAAIQVAIVFSFE